MVHICSIRHAYPEKYGITIDRPEGRQDFTFLHFFNSVKLKIDGKIIVTKPNAVIIFNKNCPQYFSANTPLVHNWFHFLEPDIEIFEKAGVKFNTLYYPETSEFITKICQEMELEYFSDYPNKNDVLKLKFNELILKLGRAVKGYGAAEFNLKIKNALIELRSNMFSTLEKKWTTEKMAKEVGISQPHFYSCYRLLFGVSPTNDLINARITKAKNMLIFEKMPISEICAYLGYDNLTHFERQFKSKVGVSPNEYRKMKKHP